MKVLDYEAETPRTTDQSVDGSPAWLRPSPPVDRTRCTRCREPWTCHVIEDVEIWECGDCGYEARERGPERVAVEG